MILKQKKHTTETKTHGTETKNTCTTETKTLGTETKTHDNQAKICFSTMCRDANSSEKCRPFCFLF
jgi:hypothetical protein